MTVRTATAALALAGATVLVPTANASADLASQVSAEGANRHLIAFQRIADTHGGNRAAMTTGYDASVDYVAGRLREAGFDVTTPTFEVKRKVNDAGRIAVGGSAYDLIPFGDTPNAEGLTAPLRVVAEDGTPGCEASDFAGQDFTGSVALIRRGSCTFVTKYTNAVNAGAAAVIISNNADGPLDLRIPGKIPGAGVTKADGTALAAKAGQQVTVELRHHDVVHLDRNVIAQTRTGREDNVVMAGAHLDSVEAGPGMNDNGSGSAALLEIALKMGARPGLPNAVRFTWWGAEEAGLVGSKAYAAGLTFEQQLDIALYLNFDMVGSPNPGYFVYNDPGLPYGSKHIEKAFTDYYNAKNLGPEGLNVRGASDYGSFTALGIPAGGIISGGGEVKTPAQAAKWGGTAGVEMDPCYHRACDHLGNINREALGRNVAAAAHVIAAYGVTTEGVNGVPSRAERAVDQRRATASNRWLPTSNARPSVSPNSSTDANPAA
ncbi:M28 family peptidase [Lentzea sp. NPDC051838]|uniref:M28 family peptidase n=1 Tax=Lentzea sp. NPDC051838 TaxID=3154849 RepID=UPI00343B475D